MGVGRGKNAGPGVCQFGEPGPCSGLCDARGMCAVGAAWGGAGLVGGGTLRPGLSSRGWPCGSSSGVFSGFLEVRVFAVDVENPEGLCTRTGVIVGFSARLGVLVGAEFVACALG